MLRIPSHIFDQILKDNARFEQKSPAEFVTPTYNPETYVADLTKHRYFDALVSFRHYVQQISHHYFASERSAKNVDLFMLTPSVSSPMGPGSDSEAITIEFGGLTTHLVDSSQFGFEPLLFQTPGMVYCYLPSMRGEDPDARHLNQFYHCECELVGTLEDAMGVAEEYVRRLCETVAAMRPILDIISSDPQASLNAIEATASCDKFPRITFDRAIEVLMADEKTREFVRLTPHGRDITSMGEIALSEKLGSKTPFWITHYDRDRVPFYQKPSSDHPGKVENADLIFPPLIPGAFGGEVVGCGQRQDTSEEILESLRRQNDISPHSYQWYIDLRSLPGYRTTSGFGLGIERFLVWILAKPHIRDVSLYPRLKGTKTYP